MKHLNSKHFGQIMVITLLAAINFPDCSTAYFYEFTYINHQKTDEHFDMLNFILSKRLVAVCAYNKGQ